jgi:PAS domain S-box-containing protein
MPLWIVVSLALAILFASGLVVGYFLGRQSQTQRRMEEFIATAESVFDALPIPIYLRDTHGRFILTNKAHCNLIGRKREEVIGKTVFDLYLPEQAERFAALDRTVLESGQGKVVENQVFSDAKGHAYDLVTTKGVYRGADGKFSGIIGISLDVTERKHAEERVREQATLLDQAQDAIFERDLDGRILFWNKGAERIYGWRREEVLGKHIADVLKISPQQYDEFNRAARDKGGWSGEVIQIAKDGRELNIDGRTTLLRDAVGRPKSVLVVNTDITARKKIEAQLMRSQRLESIGILAGGIAHDLNNILSPILVACDLLRPATEIDRKRIASMRTNSLRGAELIRQVLSFARGTEGNRIEINLKHLLKEMEQVMFETIPKNIRIHKNVQPELWSVSADPTQLHQILMNLCVNAKDATPDGGQLILEASNLLIDAEMAETLPESTVGPHIVISINDTGVGIPKDIQKKIFDPFFTTKPLGKGTGLGLSIVFGIVKDHKGFIQIESEVGQGTIFKIYLPAVPKRSEETQKLRPATLLKRGNGELLLLVDDEVAILDLNKQVLEMAGYRTLTASNGAEAIEVFTRHQNEIKLVLTDMMMPIMDGAVAIRTIKSIRPQVRIIASTGRGTPEDGTLLIPEGADALLAKPLEVHLLVNTVDTVLRGSIPTRIDLPS